MLQDLKIVGIKNWNQGKDRKEWSKILEQARSTSDCSTK